MALDFGQNHQGLIESRHITGPRRTFDMVSSDVQRGSPMGFDQFIGCARHHERIDGHVVRLFFMGGEE
ncbi:hypothetical protein H261_05484 [Paramagnetospirillum caucaseum]|uniref:Uncharacterized protein n=1 Tax=Paramagnetospirillum caucaseum TaxID=1244869 RepID=M2ZUG0_9PROT|nr:hypothetical protein [Paramagnetospirillum caucaseum]EME71012.1 hypothetical protein H261_05484 [Paramagnetospirillum caucaseum]